MENFHCRVEGWCYIVVRTFAFHNVAQGWVCYWLAWGVCCWLSCVQLSMQRLIFSGDQASAHKLVVYAHTSCEVYHWVFWFSSSTITFIPEFRLDIHVGYLHEKTCFSSLNFVIYIYFNNYLCSEMFHCCNRVATAKTLSWKPGLSQETLSQKCLGTFHQLWSRVFFLLPRFTIKPKH